MIWRRSSRSGRSQKKISSKRPLRSSSGGSCVHVVRGRDHEHRRRLLLQPGDERAEHARGGAAVGLPDEPVPEKPFSSSSIHRIAGAIASAVLITVADVLLGRPTRPPKILPTSRRSSGICHSAPTAFAVSDLPVPGTPMSRMPLGSGRPKSRARERERVAALDQPVLEDLHAADVGELLAVLVVLEHAALADDLLLLLEDRLEVERVRAHRALGEHVLGLDEREAERGFDDALHERRIALDHLLRRRRQARQDLARGLLDLLAVRQLPVEHRRDALLELGRDLRAPARGRAGSSSSCAARSRRRAGGARPPAP